MKQFILFLIVAFTVQFVVCAEFEENSISGFNATSRQQGRFLSLFSVVRFANSFCYGSNGLNGTCLTSAECSSYGGTSAGSCASGFGVCCTVCITTCGKTASLNNTYWGNPGYPSSYSTAGQCSIAVKKTSDICQVRLDFVNFVIANPDGSSATTNTQCLLDMFTVSGQTNNVPGICGTNTNQHMYLDMTPGSDQFNLNMLLTGTSTARTWKIRISQIPCGANYLAPDGCLQWFTSSVGTFSSFNYQFTGLPTTVAPIVPVQKIANQDYTICMRTNSGYCGICYQACDAPTGITQFSLSTPTPAVGLDATCVTDWIQIPCAITTQVSTTACGAHKICGTSFAAATGSTTPQPVYSYRKPFEVRVYTDSFDAAVATAVGFCLKYQQLSCTSG